MYYPIDNPPPSDSLPEILVRQVDNALSRVKHSYQEQYQKPISEFDDRLKNELALNSMKVGETVLSKLISNTQDNGSVIPPDRLEIMRSVVADRCEQWYNLIMTGQLLPTLSISNNP